MAIEAKVAAILNNRELIINKGSEDGVEPEMRFTIKDSGLDVMDPDTHQKLGHYAPEKILVEVVEVKPKFAVARTYQTYRTPVESHPVASIARLIGPRYVTGVKTISKSQDDFEFSEESITVTVGDAATQILQPQTANQQQGS